MLILIALPAADSTADRESLEVGGVQFDRSYPRPGSELELVGAGILRWKILFRAYAAAFYLPPGTPPEHWDRDVAKCLTIHYFWDIDGDDFGPAGEAVLKRTHSAEQLRGVRAQLDAIDAAYLAIKEGDRYALVYDPGKGTTLLHNGQEVVTLPGAEFARLYFSIWLGTDPVDRGLRDELLGGR